MAINKRKALNAARKFAQKGAKEKALKEYNTLLKADPRDAKLRLEVGDAYRRWGQLEDAITQYKRVAEQYTEEGFDARAVAVYKQILNLDPKRYSAFVDLSDLYQRIGLEAEAISALQAAADGYREEGQTREALELLRKMAALDPGNTTSRIKVADLLRAEGMEKDAVCEYEAVIEELRRIGDREAILPIYERILEIEPARTELLSVISRELLSQADYAGAESYARRACDAEPDSTDALELLSEVYRNAGRTDDLADATRRLVQLFKDRGDSDRAREIVQRLPSSALDSELVDTDIGPSPEEFAAEVTSLKPEPKAAKKAASGTPKGRAPSQSAGDDLLLADDDLLGDENFLEGSTTDFDLGEEPLDELAESPPEQRTPEMPTPVGDPDQLLAEANVYLRYGKRDQARASLEAALVQEPQHRGVLDKLGEMLAEDGEAPRAVEVWERSAHLALAEGDADGFAVVRDRIATLDADAANALPDPALDAGAAQADAGDEAAGGDEHEIEFDLDLEIDVDIDLDEGADEGLNSEAPDIAAEAGEASETAVNVQFDDEDEFASSADGLSQTGEASEAFNGSASLSTTTSQQVAEDLEEAEFYFQQDLYDEAEGIYRRVLAVAPNHPSAMVRLGELAVARGDDPSTVYSGDPAAAQGDAADDDVDIDLDGLALSGDGAQASSDRLVADDVDADETEIEMPPDDETDDLVIDVDMSSDVEASAESDEEFDVEIDVGGDVEIDVAALGDEAGDEDASEIEIGFAAADESDAVEEFDGASLLSDGEEEAGESQEDSQTDALALTGEDDAQDAEPADDQEDVTEFAVADDEETEDGASDAASESAVELDLADERDLDEQSVADETEQDSEVIALADDAEQESELVDTSSEDDGETFDLAAEIRDALEEDDAAEAGEVLSTVEDGFSSIFSDFKKGVSQTLSDGDHETRYDLGIAYREMGLLEDAIGEFRLCLDSPDRRIDSLHMLGLCALDAGRGSESVGYLEQALAAPDVAEERRSGLYFDLGRAYENVGDLARARASYSAITTSDFPGVAERLAALEDSDAIELMGADDVMEPVEEAEEETFESFDDMVAEVEATEAVRPIAKGADDTLPEASLELDEVDELEVTAESDEPPEVAPKVKPAEQSDAKSGKKKPPRKRKISFV